VFTDTTCGYCRKLHNEMADYNDLGITVQYLAFPRGGIRSGSFDNLQNVWCADDKKAAMTAFKSGSSVNSKSCSTKVAQHYDFGQAVGVTGTPAIILNDGTMIPGYQPAKRLIEVLNAQ
jgi:thiol:disulfide interchange protein DsbC